MPPGKLLYELGKCGINLMPVSNDAVVAGITVKSEKTEELAIRDIAVSVRSFYVKSSHHSNSLVGDKILVRIRENLEYDQDFAEDQEKDWKSVCWWPNKCAVIKSRDSLNNCNEALLEGTETHSALDIVLRKHDLTHADAIERMKDMQTLVFTETVARFLKLTKLLSFTAGKHII